MGLLQPMAFTSIAIQSIDGMSTIYAALADEVTQSGTLHTPRCYSKINMTTSGPISSQPPLPLNHQKNIMCKSTHYIIITKQV